MSYLFWDQMMFVELSVYHYILNANRTLRKSGIYGYVKKMNNEKRKYIALITYEHTHAHSHTKHFT